MCVIVDNDRSSDLFRNPCDPDLLPLFRWVHKRDGKLIYGGQLARELSKNRNGKRLLQEWDRAGRARRINDEEIKCEEERLLAIGIRSNDAHVIALVNLSGARTVCTNDHELRQDLKNPDLVKKSRSCRNVCRIYVSAKHAHLLRHVPGCCGRRPEGTRVAPRSERAHKTKNR